MRVALLVCLLACKDQAKTEAPRLGSAPAGAPGDAAAHALPLPKLAGTPAAKTTKPIDAAKLAKLDFEGFTREVRNADDKGLDVRYLTKARPAILVSVNASRCFDCPVMEQSKWQAKSDALRYVIGPELKDHRDTTWETGMTEISGMPYAWTYHVAFDANGSHATAYGVYYNDGVNMIRVIAEYKDGVPTSREAMVAATPKHELERIAKAFADAFVHAW